VAEYRYSWLSMVALHQDVRLPEDRRPLSWPQLDAPIPLLPDRIPFQKVVSHPPLVWVRCSMVARANIHPNPALNPVDSSGHCTSVRSSCSTRDLLYLEEQTAGLPPNDRQLV